MNSNVIWVEFINNLPIISISTLSRIQFSLKPFAALW